MILESFLAHDVSGDRRKSVIVSLNVAIEKMAEQFSTNQMFILSRVGSNSCPSVKKVRTRNRCDGL